MREKNQSDSLRFKLLGCLCPLVPSLDQFILVIALHQPEGIKMLQQLAFRPTVIINDNVENDYSVFCGNVLIGRIRLNRMSWDWVINPPSDIQSWATGKEKSLNRAEAAVEHAWTVYCSNLLTVPASGFCQ